jgi:ribosomal-protein-alanine acetyltransferase
MPNSSTNPQAPGTSHPAHRSVRKFEPPDAKAVEDILRQSPQAAEWSLKSLEQLQQRGEIAWVVEIPTRIAGFLVARAVVDQAEILNLCVHPTTRRTGNATTLVQTAIAAFQRMQVKTVFLEVRQSNASAISFYQKLGFVPNGRRPSYYQNPTEDAVLMMRELSA